MVIPELLPEMEVGASKMTVEQLREGALRSSSLLVLSLGENGALTRLRRAAAIRSGQREMLLLLQLTARELHPRETHSIIVVGSLPIWFLVVGFQLLEDGIEGGELGDGGGGGLDEPLDGFAGLVVAETVLKVVELDGGGNGETNAAVSQSFRRHHLTVTVFPAGGAGYTVYPRRGGLLEKNGFAVFVAGALGREDVVHLSCGERILRIGGDTQRRLLPEIRLI